jgi:hypothetical protein
MKNDNFDKDWHHSNVPALKAFLDKQAIGPVADTDELTSLLAHCWDKFEGGGETKMEGWKLRRGIEDATWQPPYLEFLFVRHPAVVRGSKYANLQRWCLDVEALTAEVNEEGRRLIAPMDKRLNTKALAKSLANAIRSGQPDERFKILPDGSVQLDIALIIPATKKKTTEERRKRLHRDLSALLEPHGWRKTGPKVYSKEKPTS